MLTRRGCLRRVIARIFAAGPAFSRRETSVRSLSRATRVRGCLEGAAAFIGPRGSAEEIGRRRGGLAQTRNQSIGRIGAARERVWEICTRTRLTMLTKLVRRHEACNKEEGGGGRDPTRGPGPPESSHPRIRDGTHPQGSLLALTRRTPSASRHFPLLPSPVAPACPLCSIWQALLIFPRAPGVIRARSPSFALSTSVSVASPG